MPFNQENIWSSSLQEHQHAVESCLQSNPTLSGHNAPGHKMLTSCELQKFKQSLWAQCLTMENPLSDPDHFGTTIFTAHQICLERTIY